MTTYPKEMLADLRRSGLTPEDAKLLHLTYDPCPLPSKKTTALGKPVLIPVPAMRIPYWGLNKQLATDNFYRHRLLMTYYDKDNKLRRYSQPPGTTNHLFTPPYYDGVAVAKDPTRPIYIVEGEKKTSCVCKLGFYAIGVGGVWSWRTRDDTTEEGEALGEFASFVWTRRTVYLLFDSDTALRPKLRAAVLKLSEFLISRGANPIELLLPTLAGEQKTGADDFIVAQKTKAHDAILKLPRNELFVPSGYTEGELRKTKFTPPRWLVSGLLPTGLTILAGSQKKGKSFLALNLCKAVSAGATFLGYRVPAKVGVLYLALEDTFARLQIRGAQLDTRQIKGDDALLEYKIKWPTEGGLGLAALRAYLEWTPACKMIVIDTLAKIRAARNKNSDLYYDDYAVIGALKNIADSFGVAIVLIHHDNKGATVDIFDKISGSRGLTGASDLNMVLQRATTESRGQLTISGRDVEELELALEFENGVWTLIGEAATVFMSEARRAILAELSRGDSGPRALAQALGKKGSTVHQTLRSLEEEGYVSRTEDGKYRTVVSIDKGGV